MEKEKLCLRCMRKIGDSNVCPYCKNEENTAQEAPFLPLKTVVGGKYLIGKLVETNAEGSTYYAFNLEAKCAVTIREFFPKDVVSRGDDDYCLVNVGKASQFIDEKAAFIELWKKLQGIGDYSALAPITDVFEDKGTAYAVFEYLEDAKTLRDYLLGTEMGYILWDEARVLLMPVLSALGAIHNAGIVHGGISPTTLLIDNSGKLKISGFSINDVRIDKSALETEIFDGFAAIEQYTEDGVIGPWTDIYAFAGVLYRTLIGSVPMSASQRISNDKLMIPGKFAEIIPAYVINALVNSLQILPGDRTRTTEQMRDELSASPAAAGTAAEGYAEALREEDSAPKAPPIIEKPEEDSDEEPDSKKLKKSTVAAFIISAILCLAILVVVFLSINGTFSKDKKETTTESTTELTSLETTGTTAVSSMTVPNFAGLDYDEVSGKEDYKPYLTFIRKDVDSDKPIGQIISQDISSGNVVTTYNKRTITLQVSAGLEVPEVEGKKLKDAVAELKAVGFTDIIYEVSRAPQNSVQSNKVSSVVYVDKSSSNKEWQPIPALRRISADDRIVLYYYGEYVEETSAPETTEPTTETILPEDTLPDD